MTGRRVFPLDDRGHPVSENAGSAERRPASFAALALVALGVVAIVALRPLSPAVHWERLEAPPGLLKVDSVFAARTGFGVLSGPGPDGATLWLMTDGTWKPTSLPTAPTRAIPTEDGFIAYGARSNYRIHGAGPSVETSPVDIPDPVRTGYGSGRPGVVSGPGGLLVHTMNGDLLHAPPGGRFSLVVSAEQWGTGADAGIPSSCAHSGRTGPDFPPVLSPGKGFVALVAANDPSSIWPLCEPVPWRSADGSMWSQETTVSPFGHGAYVADMAWTGDLFVAVGGVGRDQPMVWTSSDGSSWKRTAVPAADAPFELVGVEGGPPGWIVVGRRSDRPGHLLWISSDAECWNPAPPEISGHVVAVDANRMLVAGRTSDMWLGTPRRGRITNSCPS